MRLPDFKGRHEAQFFETPLAIAAIFELGNGGTDFLDVAEDAAMDDGSFTARLKRSATPLVWGSPMKARLFSMPQNSIGFRKSSAAYCVP